MRLPAVDAATIHGLYEQGNCGVANLLVESVLRQLIVICRNLHREGILHSDYKADNIAARLVNKEDGTLDIEIEVRTSLAPPDRATSHCLLLPY